jgi:hypothetical protein
MPDGTGGAASGVGGGLPAAGSGGTTGGAQGAVDAGTPGDAPTGSLTKFSFFVTSLNRLRRDLLLRAHAVEPTRSFGYISLMAHLVRNNHGA